MNVFAVLTTPTYNTWFSGLRDRQAQLRIVARLKRIELGNLGDAKALGGGISEIRLAFGPGYRLYFTKRGVEVIVLLVGGDKSSQSRDIKTARDLAKQLSKE